MKQDNWKKKIYFCFTDYAKAIGYVDHNKLGNLTVWITNTSGKFLNRWEHQTISLASWKTFIQVKKKQNWG